MLVKKIKCNFKLWADILLPVYTLIVDYIDRTVTQSDKMNVCIYRYFLMFRFQPFRCY